MSEKMLLSDKQMEEYINALVHGNRDHCAALINDLIADDNCIEKIYSDVFTESLYRIGDMWERNEISVAREHLATSITESLFSIVYPKLFNSRNQPTGRKAIVSCAANEYHQIGGKIVADIFELKGIDSFFLGANTPNNDLLEMIENEQPDFIALSVAMESNFDNFIESVKSIKQKAANLDIIAGGQAFSRIKQEKIPAGVKIMTTNSLEEYIGI